MNKQYNEEFGAFFVAKSWRKLLDFLTAKRRLDNILRSSRPSEVINTLLRKEPCDIMPFYFSIKDEDLYLCYKKVSAKLDCNQILEALKTEINFSPDANPIKFHFVLNNISETSDTQTQPTASQTKVAATHSINIKLSNLWDFKPSREYFIDTFIEQHGKHWAINLEVSDSDNNSPEATDNAVKVLRQTLQEVNKKLDTMGMATSTFDILVNSNPYTEIETQPKIINLSGISKSLAVRHAKRHNKIDTILYMLDESAGLTHDLKLGAQILNILGKT